MIPAHPAVSVARRGVSAEQFIALNDELHAMIRAGVPLDVGFRGTAARSAGRLKALCERLAARVETGSTLDEALAAEGADIPALFRAVLLAGIKAGRLPDVLAQLSQLTQSVSSLRRQLRLAMIYPASVLVVAYALFTGFAWFLVPQFQRTYELLDRAESGSMQILRRAHETIGVWSWGIPVAVLCVSLLSVLMHRQWGVGLPGMLLRGPVWLLSLAVGLISPSAAGRLREWSASGSLTGISWARRAQYAGLLALMVDHDVPLPEALRLSGDACGDRELHWGSQQLARQVEQGQTLTSALRENRKLPALMSWMMGVGEMHSALAASMRQVAAIYEQRARFQMEWIRRLVPPILVLVFGGAITLIYGLALFVPLSEFLRNLANP